MISFDRASASFKSFSLLAAAARPSAITFCRVSIFTRRTGQRNFITNQATKKNTNP